MHHQKHPAGLWICAVVYSLLTFSFVDFLSLLILYLRHVQHVPAISSYALFGAFNALLFTLGIAGGKIVSHFGYRKSISLGLFCASLASLAFFFHGKIAVTLGLALFIGGFCIATPGLYALVGFCYKKNDGLADSAYTLFYLILNIGALSGTIIMGFVAAHIGYNLAFKASGVTSLLSLLVFISFSHHIKPASGRSLEALAASHQFTNALKAIIGIVSLVALSALLLPHPTITDTLTLVIFAGAILYIIRLALQYSAIERNKIFALLILSLLAVAFWVMYMWETSLLTVFAEYNLLRHFGPFVLPASVAYALDPLFVIVFGLILSRIWKRLTLSDKNPTKPTKFTIGLFLVSFGFFVLYSGLHFTNTAGLLNPIWLVGAYVFFTVAELLISSMGLSMINQLSPHGAEGLLMGFWTLIISTSAIFSSTIAGNFKITHLKDAIKSSPQYAHLFLAVGAAVLLVALIAAGLRPWLVRLTRT